MTPRKSPARTNGSGKYVKKGISREQRAEIARRARLARCEKEKQSEVCVGAYSLLRQDRYNWTIRYPDGSFSYFTTPEGAFDRLLTLRIGDAMSNTVESVLAAIQQARSEIRSAMAQLATEEEQ